MRNSQLTAPQNRRNTAPEILGDNCCQSQQRLVEVGAASQEWILAGEQFFVADAHRDENQRFIVRADGKLSAFVELESAIRASELLL
jgi:hypothetical protein